MTFKERVFGPAQDRKILVFPTQTSADSWASCYARSNPGKPAFSDSFISWDTFRDSCRNIPENLKESTYIHRLVFTTEFLKKNTLNALCPPLYPESKGLFTDEIAAALPDLPQVLENPGNTSGEMLGDIRRILDAYRVFLKENNLYEKAFIEPDFTQAAKEGRTILVFPHAYKDREVDRTVCAGVKTLEDQSTDARISVYKNTLHEIRNTLDRIRELLARGIPARDIKLTITGTEMLGWLETEAYRRNIELDVKIGKALSEYPSGAMFGAIGNVPASQWSIQSLQALLLNPVFPFRNREECLKLIRLGIEYKVVPSVKARSWISKLGKSDEKGRESLSFIITLRDRIEAITGASDISSLREAIHAFEDEYLGEKDALQTKVYSRCMEELENLASAWRTGLGEKPFALYLRILSGLIYTPVSEDRGVAVYLYPSNAGMVAPYHFALGFDDEKTRRERTVSMFSDVEGLQIGDSLIRSYEAAGAVFSCARESYTGHVTEPVCFASAGRVTDKTEAPTEADVFSCEEELWARDPKDPYPYIKLQSTELQKKWFESRYSSAARPVLQETRPEDFESYDGLKEEVLISPTGLNEFIKCPYRWYCSSSSALGLEALDYQADMEDSLEVGNMVHECLEKWLEEEGSFSKLTEESSRRNLEAIFEKIFSRYSRSAKAPYEPQLRRLYLTLPEGISSIGRAREAESLAQFSVRETEKDFRKGKLKGRIDCILEDRDGNIAILDFKKGEADKKSVQLQFYSYGLDRLPVRGAYFSVGEKKFTVMWDNADKRKDLVKDLDLKVEDMQETIKRGRFESTPSDDSCKYCNYRSICRKRFVIK